VNVAVDQAGQHEARAEIDELRARGRYRLRIDEVIADLGDAPIPNHKCARPTRPLSGPIERLTRVYDHRRRLGGLRGGR